MKYLFRCLEWNKEWACAKSLQWCPTLCNPVDSTAHPRLLCPWDSPGKNTGVGCHLFLQGIFLTQGSNLRLLSPVLAGRFFTASTTWEARRVGIDLNNLILFGCQKGKKCRWHIRLVVRSGHESLSRCIDWFRSREVIVCRGFILSNELVAPKWF